MSFFEELKRRNVVRVGIAYAVAAWIILQLTDVVGEILELPPWGGKLILALIVAGFFLALFFAWVFEITPDGVKRETDVDRASSITFQTGRKLDRAIIVLLAIGLGYFVWESRFMDRQEESPAAERAETTTTTASEVPVTDPNDAPAVTPNSVAVLPFVNMSADPDNEYFSDGLTETLLHMLAQLEELRVAARTSSFSFKNTNASIQEIADVLKVAHVLEGSVQKSGEQVRVTAQLIRADDGFHVWSQNYTRPLEDIFAIQDEIATDVADALGASLLGNPDAIQGPATQNLDAYETYLQALDEQASFSYGGLEAAEGLFKKALASDPDFKDARLGLARNYILMNMTGLLDHDQTEQLLIPLLETVQSEDPDNPEARAYELVFRTEWPEVFNALSPDEQRAAMSELRGLLAVIPDEWLVRWRVSQLVEWWEDDDEAALEVLQAGLLVDPRSAFLHARIGDQLRELDRFDEAQVALERARELDPDQPGVYTRLAALARARNDLPGHLDWMRQAVEIDAQDHEMAAALAEDFYQLQLTEEGDRWARRVSALVPGSDFERILAVARAESRSDWATVMELAASMIEGQATQREGIFPRAAGAYAHAAMQLGQAETAFNFLMSLEPGAEDYEEPPQNLRTLDLRMTGLFLLAQFAERQRMISAWEHARSHTMAAGWNWQHMPHMRMFDHVVRGEYEAAVPDALETLSQPLAQNPRPNDEFELEAMKPLAELPEVATRLSERKRERQAVREDVIAMLEGPEWGG